MSSKSSTKKKNNCAIMDGTSPPALEACAAIEFDSRGISSLLFFFLFLERKLPWSLLVREIPLESKLYFRKLPYAP